MAGTPTVLVATASFESLAAGVAETLGLPDLRIVSVEHPLGGIDEKLGPRPGRRGGGAGPAPPDRAAMTGAGCERCDP